MSRRSAYHVHPTFYIIKKKYLDEDFAYPSVIDFWADTWRGNSSALAENLAFWKSFDPTCAECKKASTLSALRTHFFAKHLTTYFNILRPGTIFASTVDSRPIRNTSGQPLPDSKIKILLSNDASSTEYKNVSDTLEPTPGSNKPAWFWEGMIYKGTVASKQGQPCYPGKDARKNFCYPGTDYFWVDQTCNFYIHKGGEYIQKYPDYVKKKISADDMIKETKICDTTGKNATDAKKERAMKWSEVKLKKNADFFTPVRINGKIAGLKLFLMPKLKKEVFFGIRFELDQYNIENRTQKVEIVARDWKESKSDAYYLDDLDGVGDSKSATPMYSLKDANVIIKEEKDPKKKTFDCSKMEVTGTNTDDLKKYTCYLLRSLLTSTGDNLYSKEADEDNYENMKGIVLLQKKKQEALGKGIGIRTFRSKTVENIKWETNTPWDSYRLVPGNTSSAIAEDKATEMMSMMVNLYLKMKYNGIEGIYALEPDGTIKAKTTITEEKFQELACKNFWTCPESSANSLKPGIQRFFVLLEQQVKDPEKFLIKYVYCDGDLMFAGKKV
ncbi:MAG: hypothetical protein GY754_40505 [bacterium]|nr:hypothetical protein [bacterium]